MAKTPSTPKRRGRPPKIKPAVPTSAQNSNWVRVSFEVRYDAGSNRLDDVLDNVKEALQTINTKGEGKAIVQVQAATEFTVTV